jgi:hypothetical protein
MQAATPVHPLWFESHTWEMLITMIGGVFGGMFLNYRFKMAHAEKMNKYKIDEASLLRAQTLESQEFVKQTMMSMRNGQFAEIKELMVKQNECLNEHRNTITKVLSSIDNHTEAQTKCYERLERLLLKPIPKEVA